MPRRKQDCPKRMKWEGGEGSPDDGKVEGDDDSGTMTPNSTASPALGGDEASSPPSAAMLSPKSPHSIVDEPPLRNHQMDKELASPRSHSRESSESVQPPRCLSGESAFSDRSDLHRNNPLPVSTLASIGIALPPTLPVAATASLFPPQTAAVAAYFNAAAVAAQQQHRLMMTSPLPPHYGRVPASPLVTSSSPSEETPLPPSVSPSDNVSVLDFSKRSHSVDENIETDSETSSLKVSGSEVTPNSPLDLSVSNRKRTLDNNDIQPPPRKQKSEYKSPLLSQWPSPVVASNLPYFAAAVAAANISPKGSNVVESWNGKLKYSPTTQSEASRALEKMSELSKLGGDDLFRTITNSVPIANPTSGRHSAWQSHWLNKGAEQAKDVLKCVWCKQSFPSLAAMTTHMKEAKHCGVNVPVPQVQSQNLPPQPPISSPAITNNSNSSVSSSNSSKPNQSDLNLLIKETMPLPRKLVRGQDVWLGKGAEQTRQILKCMWCGQSFRSLAEMTSHMQQTQHYTNIISQEQIISWKSSDDAKGGGGGGGNGSGPGSNAGTANSHVSAVLTCKVCDQAFSSLKELSNHMVKNSHYKEHIMRSITDGGRRRQTREKRKKSLPVRKLLELERAQHEFKNGDASNMFGKPGAGRITCEKCGDKIDTSLFVDHIRQCIGGNASLSSQRNFLKNALISNSIIPPDGPQNSENDKSTANDGGTSPAKHTSSTATDLTTNKESTESETPNGSSPSVLNAIEKLIEKSFDSRVRQNAGFACHGPTAAPMGSSILKRLGIDESVDYTKPLVDAQTMNLLRSYHQQTQQHFARRERSGSESSSVSERGSSRTDTLTPERKIDVASLPLVTSTPRSVHEIREKSPASDKTNNHHHETDNKGDVQVKKEVVEPSENETAGDCSGGGGGMVKVKQERDDDHEEYHNYQDNNERLQSSNADEEKTGNKVPEGTPTSSPRAAQSNSPCRNSTGSPANSDRSITPKSTNSDKKGSGSLGALSSMFDNLSGANNNHNTSGDLQPSSSKRGSNHPLAALQKLCDKTETHHTTRNSSTPAIPPGTNSTVASQCNAPSAANTPGAILAFSWACNEAVMTSDSIMKCAFCDTPFISKGAYRHHLSKMHFVKDGVIPDPVALKGNVQTSSSTSGTQGPGVKGGAGGGGGNGGGSTTSNLHSGLVSSVSKSPPVAPGSFEESPHSKFLKYTELAKQLSSKYV